MSARYRVVAPTELDAGLTRAWHGVQSSSQAFSSPYFCPQFARLAGEVRGDVRIVVVEHGSRPAGFFPYQRSAWGFGRPVGGSLSEYHGVVALPASDWCVPDLLRAADLMTWKFDHLVDPCGKFERYIKLLATSPQIDLRAMQALRNAGSGVIAEIERQARTLARKQGEVLFTLHDPRPDVWECLFRWKGTQCLRTGRADPFAFRWTRELLRRISEADSAEFAGVFSSLRVGDRVAAVHMGMRAGHVLHYWLPTYDPAYAKYSVGMILLLRIAQAAADGGIETMDLGRGDAFYKQRLMTGSTLVGDGSVERSPWLGRLAHAREAAVKVVRRIQQRQRRFS